MVLVDACEAFPIAKVICCWAWPHVRGRCVEPPVSDEEFSWLQMRMQLIILLEGFIRRHTLLPLGLGRAATSLPDKLRSWLQAIFFDVGRSLMDMCLASIVV